MFKHNEICWLRTYYANQLSITNYILVQISRIRAYINESTTEVLKFVSKHASTKDLIFAILINTNAANKVTMIDCFIYVKLVVKFSIRVFHPIFIY